MAKRRVIDIWDCPICGAFAGQRCRGTSRPLTVHLERFPAQYDPEQMVRTKTTAKLIGRALREVEREAA